MDDTNKNFKITLLSNNLKLTTYLKSILIDYKIYFSAMFLVAIIASILNVAVNYQTKEIIDAIASNANTNVEILLILFVLGKLMYHGMFFISRLLDIQYKPILLTKAVTDMYVNTLKHSLHWFDSHLSGEISNKISDFQNNVLSLLKHGFQALNNIATIIVSILFLLNVNALPAMVIFVFVLIYTPVIALLLNKQMHLQEKYVAARQETLGMINDSIANIFGIKIIGNIWTELKLKLTPALLHWQNWDRKTRKFDAYYVDNADTIMVTIMSAVQVYLLASLYQSGQITAGGFAFISMATLQVHSELDKFLEILLFEINPAIASMKASFAFINCDYDTPDYQEAKILTNVRGDITFQNVYFAYSGSNTNILSDFNLHIQAGQRIGIVGTSGAGKTTIIKCLLRYFDIQQGHILIDNQNITMLTQDSLRSAISIIPQDITMFHRSILENLQLAKYDASFEEIVAACKKARLHKDIESMPNGYNSIVGERGVKMSGGQRQRIAIARAILKNAPILILDEATSALDTPTEQLIQRSLNAMLETSNATTIVIAHRLSTLLHMSRILVIEQGRIVEDGTHPELLAKGGVYQNLWNAQVGGFLPDKKG